MITDADAQIVLTQPVLFSAPFPITNFGVDDIYDSDEVKSVESAMGVDGIISYGFVFTPVMQRFTLMADSPSITFFERVFLNGRAGKTVYRFSGTIILPSQGKKYTMNNGALTGYKALADAKRTLQPMKFGVTWQSVIPAPTGG